MSAFLRRLCSEAGYPLVTTSDGPCVVLEGTCPESVHRVRITRTRNDRVSLMLTLPPCERAVDDANAFCEALAEKFLSGAHIAYHDVEHYFFLYHVMDQKDFAETAFRFGIDADLAKPLCESVGREGWWSPAVLALAQAAPEDLHAHMQ